MPNWDDFNRRQTDAPAQATGDVADVFASVFSSASGKEVLKHLYAIYIDRRTPAGVTNEALREHEAERRVVARIEVLRDQGLERAKQRAAKPQA